MATSTAVGTVQVAIGAVRILDSSGVARNALEGDRIFLNDVITTGGDGFVQLRLDGGRIVDLTHDSSITLGDDVVQPDSGSAPAAGAAPDVAALQAAIAAGADPTQVAEATAAGAPGAGGGDSGGGHSAVILEQANTSGEVTSGYPTQPASITYPSVEPEPGMLVEGETLPETPPLVSVATRVAEGVELPPGGGTPPGIEVSAATVLEGTGSHPGTEGHVVYFTLHLDKPYTTDVTVTYTIRAGTASFPADFSEGDDVLTHTVVVPAGSTSVVVPTVIAGDHIVEPNETFDVVLVSATNATIDPGANTATITIVDDDAPPLAANDTNWAQEDLANANGNVLQDLAHTGAPRGVFADVADLDFEALVVNGVNGAAGNVGHAVAGVYGTLTLAPDGSYTYVLNNASSALQALDTGETLTEAFSYSVTDGYNAPGTATLTITIFGTNDAPVARADTNWVLEDGAEAIGNVLQHLAHPGAPSGTFGDVADTDVDEEALSVTTAGTHSGVYGSLLLNADGSYRYTLNNENPAVQALGAGERLADTFSYTASDGTESALATLTITIFGTNDAPVIGSSSVRVSEEGLEGAIPDSTGSADTTDAASASGVVAVSDIDADALTLSLSAPQESLYSNGTLIQWSGEGTHALTGTAGGSTVLSISINNSGAYSVALHGPVDHGNAAAEDEVSFAVGVSASDGTAISKGVLTITIEDDAPHVIVTGLEPTLSVDESALTADDTANFSVAFASFFGADSGGTVRYALRVAGGDGADSGLDDSVTGQNIVLVINGNVAEGHVGHAAGPLAFTVTLDATTGQVSLDQVRAVLHGSADSPVDISEPATIAAGVLKLVATVTDADGDSHSAAMDLGRTVSFLDDGPSIILPTAASVSNQAAATFTGALDFDSNVDDNAGADQGASVTFDAAQDGKDSGLTSGGSPIYLYVSEDGKTLTGSTAMTEGGVAALNTVFTVSIHQDAGPAATSDHYTVSMFGTVDNGAGVVFSDLSGTGPAGNPAWKVVESGVEGRALLFTPVAPATSVNSDSDDVGVDSQFIDYGKGLRIDFADLNVTGKGPAIDYSFAPDGHYTVNHFSFGIDQVANGTVADLVLRAYNADEDDPIDSTLGDDAQVAITGVRVYDGSENLLAAASADGTVGGIGFDFDSDSAGAVTVHGLQAGYSVVTISDAGYDRLEIVNAGTGGEDGKFSLNELEVLTINTGAPVDTQFTLNLTDADGDSTPATLSVTFEPTDADGMDSGPPEMAVYGAESGDAVSGAQVYTSETEQDGNDDAEGFLVSPQGTLGSGDADSGLGTLADAEEDASQSASVTAGAEPVDLNAVLQGLVPHATSVADYDGYVSLDTESAPGHTIVMVDPTGSGNYQPLVTLNDVTNLTLQELLEQEQVVA